MPAKAGIQFTRYRILWIPAFAEMTVCSAENSPTAQIFNAILQPETHPVLYIPGIPSRLKLRSRNAKLCANLNHEVVMGGRFGKYGDLKRKAALRKSRKQKGHLKKDAIPKSPKRRKADKDFPQK